MPLAPVGNMSERNSGCSQEKTRTSTTIVKTLGNINNSHHRKKHADMCITPSVTTNGPKTFLLCRLCNNEKWKQVLSAYNEILDRH